MLTKEWDLVLTDKTTNTNKIIGKIFPDISVPYEKWIFWKVEDDLHLHRNSQGWSILKEIPHIVDEIVFTTKYAEYKIDSQRALTDSFQYKSKFGQVDEKIYVPLKYFDKKLTDTMANSYRSMFGNEWFDALENELLEYYFINIVTTIAKEIRNGVTIYPDRKNMFNAYKFTPLSKVKVLILGQDPYHNGQATGLAFDSINKDAESYLNIYKEVASSVYALADYEKPDLKDWAKQGVMLLNTVLSVEEGKPASHKDLGWQQFVTKTVELILDRGEPLVIMLWGEYAKKFFENATKNTFYNNKKTLILQSSHPSPLSAYRGFLGCKHFVSCNEFLIINDLEPVVW